MPPDELLLACDAVLFDSDGVLVDSHVQVVACWTRLAAEFGLDIDLLLTELVGVRAVDTLGRYLAGDRLAAACDRLEDLEVETAGGTVPIAGAAELLGALPDGRWTIVTSATRRLGTARWQGAGLPVPERLVTADDVTAGKPDPQPFLAAARVLGVEPARCVVFEDSASGGRAAVAAGAAVVAVGQQPWPFEPAARVPDLRSVCVVPGAGDGTGVTLAVAIG
ncbi:MAG: HAD-IA family hydrolase [Acidimicrobiales bacterium]